MGSTVNPMDKGGQEYKELWEDSDPRTNGTQTAGLDWALPYLYACIRSLSKVFLTSTDIQSLKILADHVDGLDGDSHYYRI